MADSTDNKVVIDYTRRDYDAIRAWLVGTAKSKMPDWQTVGQPSDFGTLLLEMYAYLGDVSNYYIDRIASEAFLGTAQRTQSVYYMADMLGYSPLGQRAATVELAITRSSLIPLGTDGTPDPELVVDFVIPAGTVVSNDVEDQTQAIYFETDTDVTLNEPGDTVTVTATEGLTVLKETLGYSEGKPNTSFALANKGAIFQSVRLFTVEGGVIVPWVEVDSVSNARPNQSAFSTYLDDAGVTYIQLGDNSAGRIPPSGAEIYVSYRFGIGSSGNSLGMSSLTKVIDNAPWVSLVSVTNPKAPLGGADPESLDSMRFSIPRANRVRSRAVTLDDYVSLALQVPGVGKAIAYGSVYSAVTVRIAAVGGFLASEDVGGAEASDMALRRASVANYLKDKTLIGANVYVERVQWHDVEVEVDVAVLDGYVRSTVQSGVESAITQLFSFERLDFGQKVTKGDVYRAATKVPGVDYVELVKLRPVNVSEFEDPLAEVQNIRPPARKIAQIRRDRAEETFGTVSGLTLNMSGGLEA